MKTDALIAILATQPEPVESDAVRRRYAAALGWGAFGATLLMAIVLGVRGDLPQAVWLPMFWVKLAYPGIMVAGALFAAARLACPGGSVGRAAIAIVGPIATIWMMAVIALASADPVSRAELVLGQSAAVCPLYITLLSAPMFAAAFWAMKGLAPTRLAHAGAASGLLAGTVGTVLYALHCPEMAAPFLGAWYLLGMLIPTVLGAFVGPRVLRW